MFVGAAEHYLGACRAKGYDAGDPEDGWQVGPPFKGESVKREWWRVVPSRGGLFDSLFKRAKPRARGSFPVTVIDLEDWTR